MTHVATVVCDPAFPVLTKDMLRRASEALRRPGPLNWLDPCIAADIAFEPRSAARVSAVADRVPSAPKNPAVDVFGQRAQGQAKKLLLAYMDSTIIGQECIEELAAEIG